MSERDPTDEQVRASWHALAHDGWGSYEADRAAWVRFSIARARARRLANGHRAEPQPGPVHTPPAAAPAEAAPPANWGSLRVSHPEPLFDRKRAAAGDRDDD